MSFDSARFSKALNAKWKGNPRGALAALGLDQDLLGARDKVHRASDDTDPYWSRGGDHKNGWDSFDVPEGSSGIAPKREEMPAQNLGGKDDEPDDEWAPFRSYLQDCGLTEDEAEEACRIVQDSRRSRRGNGREEFPLNAVKSGDRPAPSRGHFAGPRGANQFANGSARPAMDAAARKRLARRFPNLARIAVEPSVGSSDRRLATDARPPSPARVQRTLRRFPGMAGVKTMGDVAHVAADAAPAARGRYEV